MKPIAVVAIGAESALGSGAEAFSVGAVGARPVTAIASDDELVQAGLLKPFVARARNRTGAVASDPATNLLVRAAKGLAAELDVYLPGWRSRRVGVAVGTSSGGMAPLTVALARRMRREGIDAQLARAATYYGPLEALDERLGVRPVEYTQVLAACASSGVAIGIGCRWLELGHADVVIAGGYDAVTPFVAAGFESLGATSATRPAPFRLARDGMALGEGAVLFALARAEETGRAFGYVCGFGAAADAIHVTAPDRAGAGLARAAVAAMRDAGVDASAIELVSAHATATPFNDAAEARALASALGEQASRVVVHPFKAVVGHTLGASAALESAAALDALARSVLPAAIGDGPVDPAANVRLLKRNERAVVTRALKLSAAFGGANAALVLSSERHEAPALVPSGVELAAIGEPKAAADAAELGNRTHIPRVQLSRLDPLSAAAVASVASVLEKVPDLVLARTGVVLGTTAATLENNEVFDARLRERRARGVEPRRFPPTSPNLAGGQCTIAFGLHGPSLSVGAGPGAAIEALLVAFDLVAAGDAEAIVVAAEHVGAVVEDLFRAAERAAPADGAVAVVLRRSASPQLSRARLARVHTRVRSEGGRLGEVRPGWPLLRATLDELAAGPDGEDGRDLLRG